jgi:Flp pilus assembly pilin Flp
MGDLLPTDMASLGTDAGMVAAINGLSNEIKTYADSHGLGSWVSRAYWALPFLAAFILCYVQNTDFKLSGACAVRYGLIATFTFNAVKKGIMGQ